MQRHYFQAFKTLSELRVKNIYHMHGELNKASCNYCFEVSPWTNDLNEASICPHCKYSGYMRPYIVWFGETPLYMDIIEQKLLECDIFASIGTSGHVYPAAGFVDFVRRHNPSAHNIELNKEASQNNYLFHETRYGNAGEIVPIWVNELIP